MTDTKVATISLKEKTAEGTSTVNSIDSKLNAAMKKMVDDITMSLHNLFSKLDIGGTGKKDGATIGGVIGKLAIIGCLIGLLLSTLSDFPLIVAIMKILKVILLILFLPLVPILKPLLQGLAMFAKEMLKSAPTTETEQNGSIIGAFAGAIIGMMSGGLVGAVVGAIAGAWGGGLAARAGDALAKALPPEKLGETIQTTITNITGALGTLGPTVVSSFNSIIDKLGFGGTGLLGVFSNLGDKLLAWIASLTKQPQPKDTRTSSMFNTPTNDSVTTVPPNGASASNSGQAYIGGSSSVNVTVNANNPYGDNYGNYYSLGRSTAFAIGTTSNTALTSRVSYGSLGGFG